MQPELPLAKIVRVISATQYHLKDCETSSTIKIQFPKECQRTNFYPLLQDLQSKTVTYELHKRKKRNQSHEYEEGWIYLGGTVITNLYTQPADLAECRSQAVCQNGQVIQCYVMKVQCLKLKLFVLSESKFITFYFSDLRLPKINSIHPKEVWQKCQEYFNDYVSGEFVRVFINGSEHYREELNIHGQIWKLSDGSDIKEKIITDGYADLSKNCEQYLQDTQIQKYKEIVKESKRESNGMWKHEIMVTKANKQLITDSKYDKWQSWNKNKTKLTDLKNPEQSLKQLCSEFKKNSTAKADPTQNKIILQAFMVVMQECVNGQNLYLVEEMVKICVSALTNLQYSLNLQVESSEFLKYLNRILIVLIFYVTQSEKSSVKSGISKNMGAELEKAIRCVFKCCFMGNQTFHRKVFNKHTQSEFQKFPYDPAYLSGISSYSEYSDYQQMDAAKNSKKQKKIAVSQTKIRINSTLLLSLIFKNYMYIVQSYWEICVKSNVLTEDFFAYLQQLRITIDHTKMTAEEKRNIAALMRTNFGDHSLILLIFFEHSSKVKINALNCLINMIRNFQGKKMIDTTQALYIQKLLKQTRSSFVPKSFIIFSGLRNILYFMLFSLHHQKNIVLIFNTFRALTELCQQSTLIDKMGFTQGMGLLMSNYIVPVLKFSWTIPELTELKILCVEFLGALVNSQKKWQEIETEYLLKQGEENINYCMLQVIEEKRNSLKDVEGDKIVIQITKYFMKMAKRYYAALFFEVTPHKSVWSAITDLYMQVQNHHFTNFVEEVLKCHFDHITLIKSYKCSSRRTIQATQLAESQFAIFLPQFLPKYGQILSTQNYASLINCLTYISYEKWSSDSFKVPKQFLLHCFRSIQDESQETNKIYPSLSGIKNNSLVRIALIKLLGYMSFCKQFQKQEISCVAIRSLLRCCRNHRSLNAVIKTTWGISNWSNIPCFKEGLEEAELKECLDYMILHSQSDKQKIASNCTRGIGFFINNLEGAFDVHKCTQAVMHNLSHPIIKVRTNSTKTYRAMVAASLISPKEDPPQQMQELIGILEQNILKNNYHLQTETLLLIKELGNPIKESQMLRIYSHILRDLSNHTTMEYEFSEVKALKQLRRTVLHEIVQIPEELSSNQSAAKEFYQAVEDFMMDSKEESSRRYAEKSEILERGFEKGQEALNAVFNAKYEKYDQEKMIATQFTIRGLQYEANEEDVQLLSKIKDIGRLLSEHGTSWQELANMSINGRNVSVGKISNC